MTKKNMLLTMLMVVINNWLLNMVLTMGLMITVKNKNDKVRDRKSTRLNSSHIQKSRMPSSA